MKTQQLPNERCSFIWFGLLCILMLMSQAVYAGRVVRVGVYKNSPKVSISETGQPEGIFIDIITAIAKKEGWQLEFVPGTWGQGLDRLTAGKIDIMPDVALTDTRRKQYSFHTEPVLSDWFQVYAKPNSGIRSILDLKHKRVSVLERSIQLEAFSKAYQELSIDVKLVPFADYDHAFEAVKRGDVDAAITNRFYGMAHLEGSGLVDTAIIFFPSRLYFGAPPHCDRTILDAIDKDLIAMKKDPNSVYYQSLQRWTTEQVHVDIPKSVRMFWSILALMLVLSVVWSITLRKQVERRTAELRQTLDENNRLYDQIKHHAEQLEIRVAERTEELARARDRAEIADQTKSVFLATMSHELRTPLNSIIGFTGILLQGLAGPLNEEQLRQLSMVKASGRHLLDLINDVLDISKIEAGQLEVSHDPFDLADAVRQVADIITPQVENKKLILHVDIAPDVGRSVGDRRRVEQVLLNLVSNAVKFTEHGEVSIAAKKQADEYVIRVTDTGIGISASDQNMIFEPFKQIDSGLQRQHDGTGLGLAICKRLVEIMGGQISVSSEVGKGSCFEFTHPVGAEIPSQS